MGQPIVVTEKATNRPDVIRLETNRVFSGMGHERFRSADDIVGDRWMDEVARRLFATGAVKAVHIYSNTITVDLVEGKSSSGMAELVEDLYTHYRPGVSPSIP